MKRISAIFGFAKYALPTLFTYIKPYILRIILLPVNIAYIIVCLFNRISFPVTFIALFLFFASDLYPAGTNILSVPALLISDGKLTDGTCIALLLLSLVLSLVGVLIIWLAAKFLSWLNDEIYYATLTYSEIKAYESKLRYYLAVIRYGSYDKMEKAVMENYKKTSGYIP